jgi:hypothetical protein
VISSNKKYCPTPDCKTIVDLPMIGNKTKCPTCKKNFCKKCGLSWHSKKSCSEAEDDIYGEWAKGKMVSKCPKCKARIERIDGCEHMSCTLC